MKKICLLIPLLLLSNNCFAILPIVYDPYDVIQNTITAKNSVQALINQAQQLKNELQNLKSLGKGHYESTGDLLSNLSNITKQGKSLSYGLDDIKDRFKDSFPGAINGIDYNDAFGKWSHVTYDTLKNAMAAMSLQGKSFSNENQNIKNLQNLSDGASGNLEGHQTSHRIGLEEISQLQKLRQVMLTQSSTQNTFMAYQLQKEQAQQAAMHDWIANSQVVFKKYNPNDGFGANDLPEGN